MEVELPVPNLPLSPTYPVPNLPRRQLNPPLLRTPAPNAVITSSVRFSRQTLWPLISNFEIGNWTLTHANGKTREGKAGPRVVGYTLQRVVGYT
jgi:hypothetical protein